MNFNVYLDDETAKRLDAVARASGKPRNALVRQAVAAWLEHEGRPWPRVVMDYVGDPDIAPFESYRAELRQPADDPFAPSPARERRKRR